MEMYEKPTDVKRCPFCGKTDNLEIMTEEFFREVIRTYGSAMIDIECKACHASLKNYAHDNPSESYQERRAALIEKWNMRGGRKA